MYIGRKRIYACEIYYWEVLLFYNSMRLIRNEVFFLKIWESLMSILILACLFWRSFAYGFWQSYLRFVWFIQKIADWKIQRNWSYALSNFILYVTFWFTGTLFKWKLLSVFLLFNILFKIIYIFHFPG